MRATDVLTEAWLYEVLKGSLRMDWAAEDGARAIMNALEGGMVILRQSGGQIAEVFASQPERLPINLVDDQGISDAECIAGLLDGYARDATRKGWRVTGEALDRAAEFVRAYDQLTRPVPASEDDPCAGGQHCCCCGPGQPCCDCDEIKPATPSRELDAATVERIRAEIINTPETADFMAGVPLEAAHQRERWGADHDVGKSAFDWFWLIGYLAQKAASAQVSGDTDKAKHHTISTAAALANWHAQINGLTDMRPGLGSTDGAFACPICGQDTPHHHTAEVVDAYHNKGSRK